MINGQVHALSQLFRFGDETSLYTTIGQFSAVHLDGCGILILALAVPLASARKKQECAEEAGCLLRARCVPDQALRKALEVKACQWRDVNVLAQGLPKAGDISGFMAARPSPQEYEPQGVHVISSSRCFAKSPLP